MASPKTDRGEGEFLRQALKLYDRASMGASHQVISVYSTSFSMATALLFGQVRNDIRNLYAVVRIADEIVDGTAAAAGHTPEDISNMLDEYERAVLNAPQHRFHTDMVLHAYAETARRCCFNNDHIVAFFASMRRDLTQNTHDPRSFNDYVYGSAEVIGLLCLSVFLRGHRINARRRKLLEDGARSLGAAFQKINFLRDLAEDQAELGRAYFPGSQAGELTERQKQKLIDEIRTDLIVANEAIPRLPLQARTGVLAATALFTELTDRLERIPAEELFNKRVSVPPAFKIRVLVKSVVKTPFMGLRSVRNSKG